MPHLPVPSPRSAGGRARAVASSVPVLILLLAGCGVLGSVAAEPSAAPAPPAIVVPSDAAIPESDGGPTGSPKPNASPKPQASPTPGVAAQCAALQDAWNETNQALVSLSTDHPRALVNSFTVAAKAIDSVEPLPAVADDWGVMAGYLNRVSTAFADVDPDDADAVTAAMTHTISAADTQRATDAGEKVTAFVAAGCRD